MSITAATYQARQTEKAFMSAVKQAAEQLGWLVVHFPRMQGNPAGFPDLLMFRGGQTILAELKTERGKLSDFQTRWLLDLDAHGIRCFMWRPSDWDEIEATLRGPS
jgi:hypothetical protein